MLDSDGRPGYAISRARRGRRRGVAARLPPCGAPKLDRNFRRPHAVHRSGRTWEQPWGERRYVRNHYTSCGSRSSRSDRRQRRLDVVFRVFDDGVGFRYEFPEQPQLKDVRIVDELTEFAVAEPATAWWIPAGEWNRSNTSTTDAAEGSRPGAYADDGAHRRRPAHRVPRSGTGRLRLMWLRRVEGQRCARTCRRRRDGRKVRRKAPFATPWRTLQIADSAGGCTVRPDPEPQRAQRARRRVVVQAGEVRRRLVGAAPRDRDWATGQKHGATTANTRRYIDFAAKRLPRRAGRRLEHGLGRQLVRQRRDFDFTELPRLRPRGARRVRAGRACTWSATTRPAAPRQPLRIAAGGRARAVRTLGVDVVKTGYVADAGQIEAQARDGGGGANGTTASGMSRPPPARGPEAAKHRIAINPHEPIKDTGLRRTYPNWVAREGARGMEYAAWGNPQNPPDTKRNLYSPACCRVRWTSRPGWSACRATPSSRFRRTLAKQLALYVVPVLPDPDGRRPAQALRAEPRMRSSSSRTCRWTGPKTRVLERQGREYAVFARKDRNARTGTSAPSAHNALPCARPRQACCLAVVTARVRIPLLERPPCPAIPTPASTRSRCTPAPRPTLPPARARCRST